MLRHDSPAGGSPASPSAARSSTSAESPPNGPNTRSRKRQRTASNIASASSSTVFSASQDHGPSIPTTFQGGPAHAYATWLNSIDPGNTFTSLIGKKVVCKFADSWAIGTVQSINVDFRQRASMTRTPAPDAQYPTKSLPYSIVWEDNTDSIVNLQTLTTYLRDFTNGAHKQNVLGPSASVDARTSSRDAAINGAAVPLPNPIPHSSGSSAAAPRQASAQAGYHMPAPAARPPTCWHLRRSPLIPGRSGRQPDPKWEFLFPRRPSGY